jgi:hypothetical protein
MKTTFWPSADHDGEYPYSGPILSWAPPSGATVKMPEVPCRKLSLVNAILPSYPGKAASADAAASISTITANNNAAASAPRILKSPVVPTLSAFRKGTAKRRSAPAARKSQTQHKHDTPAT